MEQQIQNQQLTKKERYFQKKEQKEKEQSTKSNKAKIKKIVIVSVIALGVLLIGFWGISGAVKYFSKKTAGGTPQILISETQYDFGTVSMANGIIKKTFEIKNTGSGPLEIKQIKTSCHCTTAVLKVGDRQSPTFGMDNNPFFWSEEIPAGETGTLEVLFDPAYHGPQGVGSIIRDVYMATNDPKNKTAKIQISAEITK